MTARAPAAAPFPVIARIVITSLVLAACAQATPAATPAPAASGSAGALAAPRKGGTVTMVVWQEPSDLNWELGVQALMVDINNLIQEGLTRPNEKGERVPVLATEMPAGANGGIGADGKTITYHLRPNVKWHDGLDFTCEDLQFTHTVITTPNNGSLDASVYKDLDGVDCPDPLTAVLRFNKFHADWASFFATDGRSGIFPRNAGDPAQMKTWAWNRVPTGTGPFKVDEFVGGDHITLSRNESYWQRGKPYLDQVIILIVSSSEVAKQLMKNGEADIMWNNTEADIPEVNAMKNVRLSSVLLPGGECLVMNLTQNNDPSDNKTPHPILGDVNVRKAIALGIDRQTIIDSLLNGKALPGSGDLNIDPYNCNVAPVPYDPGHAKQLLDAAGWAAGSDGIRVKNGVRLRLKYQTTTGNKLRQDSQVLIVENMEAIGIELYVENLPAPMLFGSWVSGSPINRGNFDIVMYTQAPPIDPHGTVARSYTSGAIPSAQNPAGGNVSRWSEQVTDELIEKAGSLSDWNRRKELYCQAAQRIAADSSRVYLYQRFRLTSFNDRVQGWIPSSWMGLAWNAADWWVNR